MAHSVDKSMCLFPNALKEHEMVESCFFLPPPPPPPPPKKENIRKPRQGQRGARVSYTRSIFVRF